MRSRNRPRDCASSCFVANLTSFETFEELRRGVGQEPEQVKETLRGWAGVG